MNEICIHTAIFICTEQKESQEVEKNPFKLKIVPLLSGERWLIFIIPGGGRLELSGKNLSQRTSDERVGFISSHSGMENSLLAVKQLSVLPASLNSQYQWDISSGHLLTCCGYQSSRFEIHLFFISYEKKSKYHKVQEENIVSVPYKKFCRFGFKVSA